MDIVTIIVIVLAVAGIVWAYPRLPAPGGLILVVVVAIVCLMVVLKNAGVPLHF